MNTLNCQRCSNPFYTAAKDVVMPCPYCGFVVKSDDPDRRVEDRSLMQKVCDILKGEVRIPAKTVDISDTGVGIKMMGYLPFEKDETVSVFVKELELDKRAKVVWTKKFYGISRAGLIFLPA